MSRTLTRLLVFILLAAGIFWAFVHYNNSSKTFKIIYLPKSEVSAWSLSADGATIALGSKFGHIEILEANSLKTIVTFRPSKIAISQLKFLADVKLAFLDESATFRIFGFNKGNASQLVEDIESVDKVGLLSDSTGERIAIVLKNQGLMFYDSMNTIRPLNVKLKKDISNLPLYSGNEKLSTLVVGSGYVVRIQGQKAFELDSILSDSAKISPKGDWIVWVSESNSGEELMISKLPTTSGTATVSNSDVKISKIEFSSDSLFMSVGRGNTRGIGQGTEGGVDLFKYSDEWQLVSKVRNAEIVTEMVFANKRLWWLTSTGGLYYLNLNEKDSSYKIDYRGHILRRLLYVSSQNQLYGLTDSSEIVLVSESE